MTGIASLKASAMLALVKRPLTVTSSTPQLKGRKATATDDFELHIASVPARICSAYVGWDTTLLLSLQVIRTWSYDKNHNSFTYPYSLVGIPHQGLT